jgi:hypothetical protein
MKIQKLFLTSLTFASLIIAASIPTGETAETSYPMVCRGGGAMRAVDSDARSARGSMVENIPGARVLNVYFQRAAAGSGSRPPAAGQCAWLDRGIREDEPNVLTLRFRGSELGVYQFVHRQSSITVELAEGLQGDFAYLARAIRRGDLFYLQAYQYRGRGQRVFIITRTGP